MTSAAWWRRRSDGPTRRPGRQGRRRGPPPERRRSCCGAGPACCPEVLVQGVLRQGVREAEPVETPLDLGQEPRLDASVDDVQHRVLVQTGDKCQHLDVEVPTDHRRQRQDLAHVLSEAVDPLSHHLSDTLGKTLLVQVGARHPPSGVVLVDEPRLSQVTQQLRGEEGVAFCLTLDGVRQVHAVLVHCRVPQLPPSWR